MSTSEYCYYHAPELERERAANNRKGGKRGGRGRPQAELADIKTRLSDLAEDVLDGTVDKGRAAVASQVLNTYIRAVSVELKVKEQQEIEERLAELELLMEQQKETRNYGA